jgi:hypothetical protein
MNSEARGVGGPDLLTLLFILGHSCSINPMNETLQGSSPRLQQNGTETKNSGGTLVLYGTVTITGGAVMILELLGTRIIGPFYGVSLYVCRR